MITLKGIFLTASVLIFWAVVVTAQPAESAFEKGKTIDRVTVLADSSQSYALYLPKAYDPRSLFPAIYCFDPSGRGSSAVEKYRAAAEKYDYIVIGSNNSRNGMDGQTLTLIINRLTADIRKRFSIDEKRVLAAGLSGGARVASSFAFACGGCVYGVIGSGAGFSPDVAVTNKLPFLFFGTTGYNDFNYLEMRELDKKLEEAQIPHRIAVFDGAHEWLPESLADEALAWFEIREMKAGRRTKDDRLIDELLQARAHRGEQYFAEQKYLEAYSTYSGIAEDFAGMRDVSKYAEQVKTLEDSPELKQAVKADASQIRSQLNLVSEIKNLAANLHNIDADTNTQGDLKQKIESLKKKAAGTIDSPDRRVARRTLDQVFVETLESAVFRYERSGSYGLALDNLELAGYINDKNPQIHYNRARIYALQGDKKKAIESLTKAVELGFKDASRIESEKAFDALQKDERFLKLLAGLLG